MPRLTRIIAALAVTATAALAPTAASAADAPRSTPLQKADPAPGQGRKASPDQARKATKKLNRAAKRAGLTRTGKAVGRGYFASNGYACFFAPAWSYTICFGYTGYGSGSYEIFEWGDSAGRSGYAYSYTLVDFLLSIGG
jgi:hypothetical protein